jgi:cyanophycinase
VKAFAYLDATNIDVPHDKREEAADEAVLTRLKAADIVIFTGGDQLRLTSILGGTAFQDILLINTRMKNLFMLEHLLVLQQLLTI